MLLQVDRATLQYGTMRIGLFSPTDFNGSSLAAVISWPKDGPGGDWWFRIRLEDAGGGLWFSDTIRSPNPAGGENSNTWLVPYKLGPDPLPTAWIGGFDAGAVTQVWFDVWVSPMAQTFHCSIDAVTIGVPGLTPWKLDTTTLATQTPVTIFGGYIASVEMSDAGAIDGSVDVSYACRDYKLFTDGRSWNRDYTALGMRDDQIIRDILAGTSLTPSILTLGAIASTAVLQLNFSYQTVTQCLDAIASATGLVWQIDASGVFSYVAPASTPVVIALTDQANGEPFRVQSYSEDFYSPANDVTFVGDGVTAHVSDAASIAQYGLLQWTDYDLRVTHADTALTSAQTDLARAKTPNERVELVCWIPGPQPGNIVSATAARYGWTAKRFEVQRVELTQLGDAATTEVKLTCGDYNPTIVDAIAAIAKEVNQTIGTGI